MRSTAFGDRGESFCQKASGSRGTLKINVFAGFGMNMLGELYGASVLVFLVAYELRTSPFISPNFR